MVDFHSAKAPEKITILEIIEALEGPVITYPNTGLINMVFQDMQPVANQGDLVLMDEVLFIISSVLTGIM